MHAHDRHLARARSKAHMRDSRKDERAAFTRASRRAGKVDARDTEERDNAQVAEGGGCDMSHEAVMAAEFARWEEKREVARVLG